MSESARFDSSATTKNVFREREWIPLLRRLLDSVKDITGVCPEFVDDDFRQTNTTLDELRGQLEDMGKEVHISFEHVMTKLTME